MPETRKYRCSNCGSLSYGVAPSRRRPSVQMRSVVLPMPAACGAAGWMKMAQRCRDAAPRGATAAARAAAIETSPGRSAAIGSGPTADAAAGSAGMEAAAASSATELTVRASVRGSGAPPPAASCRSTSMAFRDGIDASERRPLNTTSELSALVDPSSACASSGGSGGAGAGALAATPAALATSASPVVMRFTFARGGAGSGPPSSAGVATPAAPAPAAVLARGPGCPAAPGAPAWTANTKRRGSAATKRSTSPGRSSVTSPGRSARL